MAHEEQQREQEGQAHRPVSTPSYIYRIPAATSSSNLQLFTLQYSVIRRYSDTTNCCPSHVSGELGPNSIVHPAQVRLPLSTDEESATPPVLSPVRLFLNNDRCIDLSQLIHASEFCR